MQMTQMENYFNAIKNFQRTLASHETQRRIKMA